MRGMAVRAAALVCVTTMASSGLAAQRSSTAGGRGGAGARADGPVAAVAAPAGAPVASATPGTASAGSSFVEVREVFLSIDEVARVNDQLETQAANAKPTSTSRLRVPLPKGNHKMEAAESILKKQARSQVAPTRTVVVVFGSEDDRDKVLASLDGVQRRIVLLFANTSARTEVYDNTVLKAFLPFMRSVSNMWVYLPAKAKATDDAPSLTLSTKVAGRRLWTTTFAGDGDLHPFKDGVPASAAATPPTAPAAALVATPSRSEPPPARDGGLEAGFRVDDLVVARIPGVKLLGQPSDDAKVLGTLARAEEVVVTGAASGAFTKVQSAAAEGWVKTSLLAKSTH